jgi:hypothetical protein
MSKEFKRGNYIQDTFGDWMQITELRKDRILFNEVKGGSGYCTYQAVEGIELTEEILLKCGFISIDGLLFVNPLTEDDLDYGVHVCRHPNRMDIYRLSGYNHRAVTFKYLHQIQNLYSALTKEELNIEL